MFSAPRFMEHSFGSMFAGAGQQNHLLLQRFYLLYIVRMSMHGKVENSQNSACEREMKLTLPYEQVSKVVVSIYVILRSKNDVDHIVCVMYVRGRSKLDVGE